MVTGIYKEIKILNENYVLKDSSQILSNFLPLLLAKQICRLRKGKGEGGEQYLTESFS